MKRKLTELDKKDILNEKDKRLPSLQRKYNVSRSTLQRIMVSAGVKRPAKWLTEEEKENIRNEPKTRLKILAEKYQRSISTICKIRLYNEAPK